MRVSRSVAWPSLTLLPLLLAACNAPPMVALPDTAVSTAPVAVAGTPAMPSAAPSATPSTAAAASAKPSAGPALQVTVLKGVSLIKGSPLAGAQLRVVDAISGKPLGIVAAGAGNIVATGGGNIVATGGGNIVATGAGNIVASGAGNFHVASLSGGRYHLVALVGKRVVSDPKGSFKLAVAGLAPGRVARVIATANGKTVTCLVSGTGKTTDAKAKKKYGLAQAPDDGDLVALGDASFHVTAEVALTVSAATTVVDNSYTPMIGLLGRLKEKVRADKLDHLLDGASQQEATLEQQFDAHPQTADDVTAMADPNTGDMPDGLVKSTLDDAGVLDDVQGDATACAKDVATAQTNTANLATAADQAGDPIDPTIPSDASASPESANGNSATSSPFSNPSPPNVPTTANGTSTQPTGFGAIGMDLTAQGQLEKGGSVVVDIPPPPATPDTTASPATSGTSSSGGSPPEPAASAGTSGGAAATGSASGTSASGTSASGTSASPDVGSASTAATGATSGGSTTVASPDTTGVIGQTSASSGTANLPNTVASP